MPLNSPSTVVYNYPEPSKYDLPRVYMDTRYDPASGLPPQAYVRGVLVPAGAPLTWALDKLMVDQVPLSGTIQQNFNNLQAEYVAAATRNGHTRIRLPSGWVSRGHHHVPEHTSGNFWTYTEWNDKHLLPAEGTQANRATLEGILSTNNAPIMEVTTNGGDAIITTAPRANNYRFTGIRKQKPNMEGSGGAPLTALCHVQAASFASGGWVNAQFSLADVPQWFIWDRCLFKGPRALNGFFGVIGAIRANGAYVAMVNCAATDVWSPGTESHIWGCDNGPGPHKIVGNDFDDMATWGIIYGGGDPSITDLIPSDVEARRNRMYRPPNANKHNTVANGLPDGGTAYDGINRGVGGFYDNKYVNRILLESNFCSGNWVDVKTGCAFLFKSEDQPGGPNSSWVIGKNVTARYNWVDRTGDCISVTVAAVSGPLADPFATERLDLHDNLFTNWGGLAYGYAAYPGFTPAQGRPLGVYESGANGATKTREVKVDHNTMITLVDHVEKDGLIVSQRAAGANMSVDVSTGTYTANKVENTKASVTNLTIAAADPTNPRIDIVLAHSNGSLTVVSGTPAASPTQPNRPAGTLVLARVEVDAGVATIVNSKIFDRRPQIGAFLLTKAAGADGASGPGIEITNNLGHHGQYGMVPIAGTPAAHIAAAYTNPVVTKNGIVGATPADWPAGTEGPASIAVIDFTDAPNGDYSLKATSPYKKAGTDGKDFGADTVAVTLAVSGGVRY